jgi:hypothetical protein
MDSQNNRVYDIESIGRKVKPIVKVNDKTLVFESFTLRANINDNVFEFAINDNPVDLGRIGRWEVDMFNFKLSGLGPQAITLKVMFCLSPTLNPNTTVNIACQGISVEYRNKENKIEFNNIVRID